MAFLASGYVKVCEFILERGDQSYKVKANHRPGVIEPNTDFFRVWTEKTPSGKEVFYCKYLATVYGAPPNTVEEAGTMLEGVLAFIDQKPEAWKTVTVEDIEKAKATGGQP